MVVYYAMYTFLIIGAFFQKRFNNSRKGLKNYCIFAFVLIAGILALRHPSMGIDLKYGESNGYLGAFSWISHLSWKEVFSTKIHNYEIGYVIFCKFVSCICSNPQSLLIACSLISIASIAFLIYKYSNNPLFSFIIYLGLPCFLIIFSGLRQVIAISLTTFSFKFIENKKPFKFIITVLLAFCFHSSAIIFLVAYPIYHIKPSRIFKIFSVLAIPVVFLFRYQLFSLFSRLFKSDAIPDDNDSINLFIIFTLIYIFTLIFAKNDLLENGCRNLFWLACICQAFGGVYSIAIRVGYYFMIFLIILLPTVAVRLRFDEKSTNRNSDVIILVAINLCFIVFGLYSLYNGSWAMSNPYHFYWQKI